MKNLKKDEIEPALAKSYYVSKDGKTYTFYLRDAVWSDGTKITAHDFVYSWRSAVCPTFPCKNTHLYYPIKNAVDIAQGKAPCKLLGVKAKDDQTLVVQLEKPTPHFLKLVSFCNFYPIPKHIAEENPSWESNFSKYVSSGAYLLKEFSPYDQIVLNKNPSYWNEKEIHNKQLKIQIISDPDTSLHLFEKGKIHWMGSLLSTVPKFAIDRFENSPVYHTYPKSGLSFVTFNTESFPFQNIKIRRAFSLAICRKELKKLFCQQLNMPAYRLLPEYLMGTNQKFLKSCELEKAKTLFEEGVKELGMPISTIELVFEKEDKDICQYLQKIWEMVFGIEVKLHQFEYKSFVSKLNHRNYQAAIYVCLAQIGDPINILERFKYRENIKNYPGWENAKYIEMLEKSNSTHNPTLRYQLIEEAEKIFLSEMPLCPLFHLNLAELSHIDHVIYTPSSGIRFEKATLRKY